MSFKFISLTQIGAEALTLAALHAGSPTAAQVVSRATTAVAVANVIAAVGQGNAQQALADITAMATTADAGVQQFISDLSNQANNWLQTQMALNSAIPLIGAAAQQIATDVAAGMTLVASRYVTAPAAATAAAK